MSTVIGFEKCPRCKNETLWVDYDCRTGEHDYYCQKCGCGHHYRFMWNGNKLVTEDIIYPRENLIFAVKDLKTDKIIWEKSVADVKNLTTKMIAEFINGKKVFEDVPDGFENIYDISDNYKQLYFIGNAFRIDDEETLVLEKVITEDEAYDGYGLIVIDFKDDKSQCFVVMKEMSREDVLNKYEEMVSTINKEEIKSVSVTWFNEDNNTLEELV